MARNIQMFRNLGLECRPFKYFPARLLYKRCDYLYLNWYENIYKGAFPVALGMYLAKRFALLLARLRRVQIISSQHNRVQHDAKYKKLSFRMFEAVYKSSRKIVVFSPEGEEDLKIFLTEREIRDKMFYIPPVNYIGAYPYVRHEWITALHSENFLTILFVGNLNHPYKNVEMVLDLARELNDLNIKFVFAGKLSDKAQKERYLAKIEGLENVVAEFRYVRDDEMAALLEACDVVIAPYDVESISNSGTTRLAFSYGRTVLCPMIPSLRPIPQELVYTYSYKDKNDHKEKLKTAILRAYKDFERDKSILARKGGALKAIMQERNAPEVVAKRYGELFERLAR